MDFRAIKTDKLVDSTEEIAADTMFNSSPAPPINELFLDGGTDWGQGYYSNGPLPPPIHRGDYNVSQYSKVEVQRMRKRI